VASLLSRIARRLPTRANETTSVSFTDWAKMFAPGSQVMFNGRKAQGFDLSRRPGGTSSIVYTCEAKRISVFSEARMAWQRLRDGRAQPGDLFGTDELSILERPWRGATIRDLLALAELDVAHHGNSYWVRDNLGIFGEDRLIRLDPNTVKVITEAAVHPVTGFRVGETLIGYAVTVDRNVSIYAPEEIAHYHPIPDANNPWVGSAWISAALPDIETDVMLTEHKRAQIANGADLTHVVSLDPNLPGPMFDAFVEKFEEKHRGPSNAGKTLFLQAATDIKTVGQTFEEMALRATQGAGETRVAAASGVSPVILGLSEGLGGAALNAGNYQAAKRMFVDSLMCPLWGAFVNAFASLVTAPVLPGRTVSDARLWYDARDIPFLREDISALAEVVVQNTKALSSLLASGFTADAAVQAVLAGDLAGLLGNHSGLFSVQLQPPGIAAAPPTVPARPVNAA